MHYSGFINIIGKPNVGKSTLMNALVGERMSIITHKPQTTRHRIMGILSGDDFQMVFSDTPGIIYDTNYKMQEIMNNYAFSTKEDADIMMYVTTPSEKNDAEDSIINFLNSVKAPKFLVVNKIDLHTPEEVMSKIQQWDKLVNFDEFFTISALEKKNIPLLFNELRKKLPEGPAYYPKDQLSDKSERFFVSEIIREKILEIYRQEIPYSTEVVITEFKEGSKNNKPLVRIFAEIYVSRSSQKPIILGKGGALIKKLGIESRKSIEKFLEKHVHLELFVKIQKDWRNDDRSLKHFGYQ
ncbi:GTPase Era [Portibacter lacus]|uniref:GTPase Era n=1 Tax=Portibacter lacus TaxID=1099794 RepID=A0AA37WG83_9BACT|nr:GTPase Era [Portibacter lacus]GLR19467.1 GTPase Era [Portibacter lacus]